LTVVNEGILGVTGVGQYGFPNLNENIAQRNSRLLQRRNQVLSENSAGSELILASSEGDEGLDLVLLIFF